MPLLDVMNKTLNSINFYLFQRVTDKDIATKVKKGVKNSTVSRFYGIIGKK